MLGRNLFILTIFVFINSGASIEPRYNFNHPPSAEYYNPIQGAVIYDDSELSGDLGNTNEAIATKNLNEKPEDLKLTTEPEEPTTIKVSVPSKPEQRPKSRSLKEFQIPVIVVYENSTDIQNHQNQRANSNVKTSRGDLNQRKAPRSYYNVESTTPSNKEVTISEAHTEKPQNGPRTFKKRVQGRDPVVPILESENYVFSHNGNFHYRYEGGDGTIAYSEGKLKQLDEDNGEAVVGGFSYTDKDGNDFSLSYTADENGYRPVGAHLPTPPPIPPAIARALKYLATATPEPVTESLKKHKYE